MYFKQKIGAPTFGLLQFLKPPTITDAKAINHFSFIIITIYEMLLDVDILCMNIKLALYEYT